MKNFSVVIITGLSGSGKSVALKAFEDIGYYCIDNLPIFLFKNLLELSVTSAEFRQMAIVMDSREAVFFNEFEKEYEKARAQGFDVKTLFLEAAEWRILQRYSETRRKHPLYEEGDLNKSVKTERGNFEQIKNKADMVIDTTELNVHELRKAIAERFGVSGVRVPLHVTIVSFGYKYGGAPNASLTLDVRFLPNPFFVEDLKDKTGLDPSVFDYVMKNPETGALMERVWCLVDYLLPNYEKEGKHYLTIAVGCTGGAHRSVSIVEELAGGLREKGYRITVTHRELTRKQDRQA